MAPQGNGSRNTREDDDFDNLSQAISNVLAIELVRPDSSTTELRAQSVQLAAANFQLAASPHLLDTHHHTIPNSSLADSLDDDIDIVRACEEVEKHLHNSRSSASSSTAPPPPPSHDHAQAWEDAKGSGRKSKDDQTPYWVHGLQKHPSCSEILSCTNGISGCRHHTTSPTGHSNPRWAQSRSFSK